MSVSLNLCLVPRARLKITTQHSHTLYYQPSLSTHLIPPPRLFGAIGGALSSKRNKRPHSFSREKVEQNLGT